MPDEAPTLVLTQGDPAGIGPEIIVRMAFEELAQRERDSRAARWRPLLVAERAAFEPLRAALPDLPWQRLQTVKTIDDPLALTAALDAVHTAGDVPVVEPEVEPTSPDARHVVPGKPSAADAHGALAALDRGVALVRGGVGAALVTAPLSKAEIARHLLPDFRGHTDYLAEGAGLTRYGRDYLMAFLAPRLKVALLSTHIPLRAALDAVTVDAVLDALRCLHRNATGRIAVAGLDPHAGEGGLLGSADAEILAPAVARARAEGIDAHGPESADSLFARTVRGAFDWVLALYHDQGLIAVKTAAFGDATNWTLGLPYLRTSVDHGTAYDLAGTGTARIDSLRAVVATTLEQLAESS
ncbi:MAG: 4-hydroxythreonine-4-phosphate dehydrogenase PdxA [Acidobacteriota bacterium]